MSRRRAARRLLAWTRYLARYNMLSTPGYRRAAYTVLRRYGRLGTVALDTYPYLWWRTGRVIATTYHATET